MSNVKTSMFLLSEFSLTADGVLEGMSPRGATSLVSASTSDEIYNFHCRFRTCVQPDRYLSNVYLKSTTFTVNFNLVYNLTDV